MLSRISTRLLNRPANFYAGRFSRGFKTVVTSAEAEDKILVEQRKNRPSSPHLTIYQPQLTWYMSTVHRVSGIILAAGFYGITCSYAFASLFGHPIDSVWITELFQSLPVFLQQSAKVFPGFLFFYHFANGIRHLIWDTGKELSLKGVYRTGYAALAFSTIATAAYCLLY